MWDMEVTVISQILRFSSYEMLLKHVYSILDQCDNLTNLHAEFYIIITIDRFSFGQSFQMAKLFFSPDSLTQTISYRSQLHVICKYDGTVSSKLVIKMINRTKWKQQPYRATRNTSLLADINPFIQFFQPSMNLPVLIKQPLIWPSIS